MSDTPTVTIRLNDSLLEFVETQIGRNGSYEDAGDYIRDLIRHDKERAEQQGFDKLKAELGKAFAVSDADYVPLDAAQVIARNRH